MYTILYNKIQYHIRKNLKKGYIYIVFRLPQNNLEAHARWAGGVETLHARNHELSARIIINILVYII